MNKKYYLLFSIIFILAHLVYSPSIRVDAANNIEDGELTYFDTKGNQLRSGQNGINIYQLKSFLLDMKYEITELNYTFDEQTKKAVMKFQKDKKLAVDGIVGKKTFTAINKLIKTKYITLPTFSLKFDKEAPKGSWIIINKSNNTLYWMDNTEIIKVYPVATGSKPTYTPEGKFKIVMKVINPSWGGGGYSAPIAGGKPNNPLGKRWMGLNKGGGGQYGIHGNADEKSIGTYASRGCIRMHNADVTELFPDVKKDTPVWIGTENKLKSMGISFAVSE